MFATYFTLQNFLYFSLTSFPQDFKYPSNKTNMACVSEMALQKGFIFLCKTLNVMRLNGAVLLNVGIKDTDVPYDVICRPVDIFSTFFLGKS